MPTSHYNFAYGPFPSQIRGDQKGAFFESIGSDGVSHYVIIRVRPYDEERASEFEARGVPLDEQYAEIRQFGRPPKLGARWLYTVENFDVAREHHADAESFADHSQNYSSRVFDDFEEAIIYCERELNVRASEFKKQWETNYVS